MASVGDKKLLDQESLSGAGPHTGLAASVEHKWTDFIFVCTCANAAGTTTDVVVEESPDGVTWQTLATIPQVSGNSSQWVKSTAATLPNLRAVTTLGGALAADVTVRAFYDGK